MVILQDVKTVHIPPQGMYIRSMNPGFAGVTKWEARTFLMGLTMQKGTFFSKEEAAAWVSARVLEGGFDRVTVEVVEDGEPGRA